MAHIVIENPIINSPFGEPARHFKFDDDGITDQILPGRRASGYFIPIARPRSRGAISPGDQAPTGLRNKAQGPTLGQPAKTPRALKGLRKSAPSDHTPASAPASVVVPGALSLFRNDDGHGAWLHRPNTILIDSTQLDSGESLSPDFKKLVAREIDEFKHDLRERFPGRDVDQITDEDLLREVMNTVGKPGKLGEQVRCVVSVSMLTEGWDANTVTHILGVRAFGTQLLSEQVVGRGLRRMSYAVSERTLPATDHYPQTTFRADTQSWEQKLALELEQNSLLPLGEGPGMRVLRYLKNHNLGFTIPYTLNGQEHQYIPDFIAVMDDGHGPDNPLNLIIEVTGEKKKDKEAKVATAKSLWIPAVNNANEFGRWDFLEVSDPWNVGLDLKSQLREMAS